MFNRIDIRIHTPSSNKQRAVRLLPYAAIAATLLANQCVAADEEESGYKLPGLPPSGVDWTFNFNATVGTFGFAHSLYTNPHPGDPSGDLTDNWSEGSIKPALSALYKIDNGSRVYGKFSGVGERTFGAAPPLVGNDNSSYDIE